MGDNCAPRFTSKPALRQDGANIVFNCELEANPEPTVAWFRGAEKLLDNDRIKTSVTKKDGNKFSLDLVVKNVSPDDSGSYKVEAKNALGQMSANINLNLQGKLRYCCMHTKRR